MGGGNAGSGVVGAGALALATSLGRLGEHDPIVRQRGGTLPGLGRHHPAAARREPLPLAGRRAGALGGAHLRPRLALLVALSLALALGLLARLARSFLLPALEPVVLPPGHQEACGPPAAGLTPATTTTTAATAGTAARARVATATAVGLGARDLDLHPPAVELPTVEVGDGLLRLLVGRHLHEAEALGATAELIGDDAGGHDRARLREEAVETLVRGVVTEPADEELLRHGVPIVFRVGCARPGAGNHRERRLMGGSKVSQCPDQAHTV